MSSSPLFAARWAGTCPDCGERFAKDDEVGYNDGADKPSCGTCYVDTFVPYNNY